MLVTIVISSQCTLCHHMSLYMSSCVVVCVSVYCCMCDSVSLSMYHCVTLCVTMCCCMCHLPIVRSSEPQHGVIVYSGMDQTLSNSTIVVTRATGSVTTNQSVL